MTDPQTDVHVAFAAAILDEIAKTGTPITSDGRVMLIVDAAETLSAQYPSAIGRHVHAAICQHLNPEEIAALDEHYLPGAIDDAISYAMQAALVEVA